ncbi:MAG: M20/M25/M40 family metallo-hydrolase [Clostridia bacterium]|nr:M20/M25/M40 family metallo-hydrolase [Clostridia bacterium]
MNSSAYQWDIVQKLSFCRPAGTAECERAAEMIAEEVRALGGEAIFETFTFPSLKVDRAVLRVTEPYQKDYDVVGYGFSGEIEGDFAFRYVERGTEFDMDSVDGGIVMINKLEPEQYAAVINSPAEGFVVCSGKFYDPRGLTPKNLGRKLRETGKKPGFCIHTADAIEMVKMGASAVHCELKQHETTTETANVYSVIPGTEIPDEYITFSAHYDSVDVGVGAYDNATGVAALLDLYRYFMENKPKRTLVFLWCGAEERGLLGSKEFVKKHPEIMEHAKMEINFDLIGCAIGYDGVSVAAAESVCEFVRNFAAERRHSFVVSRHAASSDSTSFAGAGIPAFNFYRYGEADIHNHHDILFPLFEKTLGPTVEFVRDFVAACYQTEIPFDTAMPEDMAEEVRKYLG